MFYLQRVITCSAEGVCQSVGNVDKDSKTDATLWITDSAERGNALLAEEKAVLIWLHEGNRGQDFSRFRYACDDPHQLDMDYLDKIYRRYQKIPWDILETKHCLVRETTVEDVESFYEIYREPSITRYMDGLYADKERERAYAKDYIDKVYAFYGFGIWTVLEKQKPGEEGEPQIIGRAGICGREGYDEPELGFVIAADRQGLGYATEVCRAILQYGHDELGFDKILSFVHPENAASVRVCEKIGMVQTQKVTMKGTEYIIMEHKKDDRS